MSNIGFLHFQLGGTDGVSLEIDKWRLVLERMGHQVYYCAGDLGTAEGTLIPELFHHHPEIDRLYLNTFSALIDFNDDQAYASFLFDWADRLKEKLKAFIDENQIDILIPNNVFSVASNPAAAIALGDIIKETGIPTIAHHHDFYWERYDGVALSCKTALDLADKYLPPRDEVITHVVINLIARDELLDRKGIEAAVIPNVFNFDGSTWEEDEYNHDLRERIGISENDLVILQATRIVSRKGFELAVDFVKALDTPERREVLKRFGLYDGRKFTDDSRIVFVLAGYAADDITGVYVRSLKQKIDETGIDAIYIEDLVAAERGQDEDKKIYSLWDTYVIADLVCYPSLWEGWGNQLLECVYARKPMLVFEYPVYKTDIKDKGFKFISLGDELRGTNSFGLGRVSKEVINKAIDSALPLLVNKNQREDIVSHNYQVGSQFYSLDALGKEIEELIHGF